MDADRDTDRPVPAADGDPTLRPGTRDAVARFAALCADGRWFDAHEELETVWRRDPCDPVMVTLQGLIQFAVALEHHRRGNAHGARVLLERAWSRLAAAGAEDRLGVDLGPLRAAHPALHAAFADWDAGGPRPHVDPPAIRTTR